MGASTSAQRLELLRQRFCLFDLVSHPALRRVEVVELERESPTIAMAEAQGESLAELADDGKRVVQALAEVAACIAEAHRVGLYSVDLRCERIPVCSGQPRLDFTGLRIASHEHPPRPQAEGTRQADLVGLGKLVGWALERPAVLAYCRDRSHRDAAKLLQLASGAGTGAYGVENADQFARLLAAIVAETPTEHLEAEGHSREEYADGDLAWGKTGEVEIAPVERHESTQVGILAMPRGESGFREPAVGDRLGRFEIEAKLGEGGMGAVFRAADLSSGQPVAIKVLSQQAMLRGNAVQRFQKEARLLASVNNPYVTNLIEVNDEGGQPYLVLEYVDGIDVGRLLEHRGATRGERTVPEHAALSIAADVARALVDAHRHEIVHRDIKPDNIMLVDARLGDDQADDLSTLRAKLTDFGIARHVDQSQSLALTVAGGMIGTPVYMAPEQCRGGGDAGPPADVYALGITLFEMLTGRTPFIADDPMKLVGMHCFEPAPLVRRINPLVSEAAERLIDKCLQKHPSDRYADATHLLRELDGLLRGEATSVAVRPMLPVHDATSVVGNVMTWELRSPPEQVWPYVSNTERLNRAIGLPPVEYRVERDPQGGVRRWGTVRLAGLAMSWEEHPFEWVEGRRMSVLREFTGGPFRWFVSTVTLARSPEGGTTLRHEVRILPRGVFGRWVAKLETGAKCRRSLDRVYTRIDQTLRAQQQSSADAFEAPARLDHKQRDRLAKRGASLAARGLEPLLVDRLCQFLAESPAQEAARIRPVALADRLRLDEQEVIDACLLAAKEGLLQMQWDILCPTCRVAADSKESMKKLAAHAHCEACDVDFRSDLAGAVELVFRVHPDLRDTSIGRYCVGGPWHAPHVVAQLRLEPHERCELELEFSSGDYLLRGPRLPDAVPIRVQAIGAPSQHTFALAASTDPKRSVTLRNGMQLLTIENGFDVQQIVRIEKTIPRGDVITAARAAALPRFRELFPGEVLDAGQAVASDLVTLLTTAIPEIDSLYAKDGDADAYALVESHLRTLETAIRAGRGEVVKVVGEGVIAAFGDTHDAVETAFALDAALAAEPLTANLTLAICVHQGPAIVTTANGRLDYFGAATRQALALPAAAGAGVTLTEAVAADPRIDLLLTRLSTAGSTITVALPGRPRQIAQRYPLETRVLHDC